MGMQHKHLPTLKPEQEGTTVILNEHHNQTDLKPSTTSSAVETPARTLTALATLGDSSTGDDSSLELGDPSPDWESESPFQPSLALPRVAEECDGPSSSRDVSPAMSPDLYSDSDSSKHSRVSFGDEVSVRYISEDGRISPVVQPAPIVTKGTASVTRPPLPTKTASQIRSRIDRRKRVLSSDQILCARNMQDLFGIDQAHLKSQTVHTCSPNEAIRRKHEAANSSPYLDSMSDRVDDLTHVLSRRQLKYGLHNPWTGHVWLYIGGYYFRHRDFERAEQAFLQAAECNDGAHPRIEGGYVVAEAFANLGVIYWNLGDTEKAVKSLEIALSWHESNEVVHDRDPDMSLNVAMCLDKLSMACTLNGSFEKAKRALTHCAHIHYQIGSDRLEFARILERLGMVNLHAGNLDEAMSCYTKALHEKHQAGGKHHPSLVSTYQNIAIIHKAQGRFNVAEQVLLYAYRIQDLQWKKHQRAREMGKARQLCFEMGETLESLGQLFKMQHKTEKYLKAIEDAQSCYTQAGLQPGHPKLNELIDLKHNLLYSTDYKKN